MEYPHGYNELSNGMKIPKIGLGCWNMGNHGSPVAEETEAVKTAIDGGMILLDTAEQYGNGLSESFLGRVIKPIREKLFIVSKVLPSNAGKAHIFNSCEQSLKRLGIEYLDLYLLHWRSRVPLSETVECMEKLVKMGKIKSWGVSNFDKEDMEELWSIPNGNHCVVNQVLYHLGSRGIEYDLIPWMREHNVKLMAYCPIAQAGDLNSRLFRNKVLNEIAKKHDCTIVQILLRFTLNCDICTPIPKSAKVNHVMENLKAIDLKLSDEEWEMIEREFPAPTHKESLDMV